MCTLEINFSNREQRWRQFRSRAKPKVGPNLCSVAEPEAGLGTTQLNGSQRDVVPVWFCVRWVEGNPYMCIRWHQLKGDCRF